VPRAEEHVEALDREASECDPAGQVVPEEPAGGPEERDIRPLDGHDDVHARGSALRGDHRKERPRLGAELIGRLLGGYTTQEEQVRRLIHDHQRRLRSQGVRKPGDPVHAVVPEDAAPGLHLLDSGPEHVDLVLEGVCDRHVALGGPAVVAGALRVDDAHVPAGLERVAGYEADEAALAATGRTHDEQVRRFGGHPPRDATAGLRAEPEGGLRRRPCGTVRRVDAMPDGRLGGILPLGAAPGRRWRR
jgi:hypothetical protein